MKILSIQRAYEPWLITAVAHAALVEAIMGHTAENFVAAQSGEGSPIDYSLNGEGVAVLSVGGMLCLRPSSIEKKYFGMSCLEELGGAMDKAAKDPMCKAMVLAFNSPGGTANGTPELAMKVRELCKKMPVVSFTDSLMASAAYEVGSQAHAVIATRSASVGSIGTVVSFLDVSKAYAAMGIERKVIRNEGAIYKGMGATGAALTPEQEAQIQDTVNQHADMFKQIVLDARPNVKAEAMRGQTMLGGEALSAGLIDGIGGMDLAIKTALDQRSAKNPKW